MNPFVHTERGGGGDEKDTKLEEENAWEEEREKRGQRGKNTIKIHYMHEKVIMKSISMCHYYIK